MGGFGLEGLVPGVAYSIETVEVDKTTHQNRFLGWIGKPQQKFKTGETQDWGDVFTRNRTQSNQIPGGTERDVEPTQPATEPWQEQIGRHPRRPRFRQCLRLCRRFGIAKKVDIISRRMKRFQIGNVFR